MSLVTAEAYKDKNKMENLARTPISSKNDHNLIHEFVRITSRPFKHKKKLFGMLYRAYRIKR